MLTTVPSPVIVEPGTNVVSNAVPLPLPTPVAVNTVPTLLSAAPMPVNVVLPADVMMYSRPITKPPAVAAVAPWSVHVVDVPRLVMRVYDGKSMVTTSVAETASEGESVRDRAVFDLE